MKVSDTALRQAEEYEEYSLRVDFVPGSEDPSRVFESMAELIRTFEALDGHLAASVSAQIQPHVILQSVEAGSFITRLRVVLEAIDDDALKELNWKKLVGSFLVKAKKRLVEWLKEKERLQERKQLEQLSDDFLELAKETDVRWIETYESIPIRIILLDLIALGVNV